MIFRKGRWRWIISWRDAEILESQLRDIKPVLVDEGDDSRATYTRRIFLFLNPEAATAIRDIFVTDDFYNAMISLQYDRRTDPPRCLVDLSEASRYLLACNLWICTRGHVMSIAIPPGYIPRCRRCGNRMDLIRTPILPHIDEQLVRLESKYAKEEEAKMDSAGHIKARRADSTSTA